MFSPSIFKTASPNLHVKQNQDRKFTFVTVITQSSTAQRFIWYSQLFVLHAKKCSCDIQYESFMHLSTLNAKHLRHLFNRFEKHERWEMCVGWTMKYRNIFLFFIFCYLRGEQLTMIVTELNCELMYGNWFNMEILWVKKRNFARLLN